MRFTPAFLCCALLLRSASAAAQGSIVGTVYDSLSSHAPLANATVVLVERGRYATTDARGHFRIDSVPDGHYSIGLMHAVLDSLDIALPLVSVEVAGGHALTVALATPSIGTVYARICPARQEAQTGVIIGRVRDVDDKTVLADAAVSTDWTEYSLSGAHTSQIPMRAVARTNRAGVYALCGVPTDVALDVRAELDGLIEGPVSLTMNGRVLTQVDFAVSRRDSSARNLFRVDSLGGAALAGTAVLRGGVRGSDGRALPDAVVAVVGTERSGRTDAAGVFRIDKIPAGTRGIEVRAIGFLPETYAIDFATNAMRDTTFSISRRAQDLKAVSVKAKANSMSLAERYGFYERRTQGLGAFVTDSQIARHSFQSLAELFVGLRGIHIEWPTPPTAYMYGVSTKNGIYCKPNYFLDGARFFGELFELNDVVPVETIKGVEVYDTSGVMPAQFDRTSSTGCGSIVIWTR